MISLVNNIPNIKKVYSFTGQDYENCVVQEFILITLADVWNNFGQYF